MTRRVSGLEAGLYKLRMEGILRIRIKTHHFIVHDDFIKRYVESSFQIAGSERRNPIHSVVIYGLFFRIENALLSLHPVRITPQSDFKIIFTSTNISIFIYLLSIYLYLKHKKPI
jgi:hypothetical protein